MDKLLTPATVAEIIGCADHDLKNWRRLDPDHPRHLPSVRVDGRHHYDPNTLISWLERPANILHREFVIASYAPIEPRLELAMAAQRAGELRGTTAVKPVGLGLLGALA